MLAAHDVTVRLAGRAVLELDALTLARGTVTAVLGPNGAGKSTLLAVLALLRVPERGTLVLDGMTLRSGAARRRARRRVTLVEQAPLLFRGSVRDNLAFPGAARGGGGGDLVIVAERLGIADLLARDARGLSGGETQRVALARALLCRPDVLLLDEPASAGDRTAIDTVTAVLAEARAAGMTVAVASHHLGHAYQWSTRIVGMAAGRLTAVTPENLFRADLPPGDGPKVAQCGRLTLHVATDRAGAVVLAIPPEDIVLSAGPLHASPRNTFAGRVTGLAEEGPGRLSVRVDAGETLVARATPGAVAELGLTVGSPVVLSIKATAVRVL